MNSLEQWISGITAAVCMVLLVRLCLGAARQRRFDHAVRTLGRKRRRARASGKHLQRVDADASDADDGEWQGNVYTPKSFRKPRKPH